MDASNWIPGGSATLTNPTPDVLRVSRNGVNNPSANQDVVEIGKVYRVAGEARSDGNVTPRVLFGGLSGDSVIFVGTTSTSWQSFDVEQEALIDQLIRLQALTSTGTEYGEFRNLTVREVL
jgi:hypothetical protein